MLEDTVLIEHSIDDCGSMRCWMISTVHRDVHGFNKFTKFKFTRHSLIAELGEYPVPNILHLRTCCLSHNTSNKYTAWDSIDQAWLHTIVVRTVVAQRFQIDATYYSSVRTSVWEVENWFYCHLPIIVAWEPKYDTSTKYGKDEISRYSLQFERSKTEVKRQEKSSLNTVRSVLWPIVHTIDSCLIILQNKRVKQRVA